MADNYHIRTPYEDEYMTGRMPRLKLGFDTALHNLDVISKELSAIVNRMEELRKELEKL